MKIAILAVCFYRYKEILESLDNIISTIVDPSQLTIVAAEMPSPNSDKVKESISILKSRHPKVTFHHLLADENHISGGLLTASLSEDGGVSKWMEGCDYIAVIESDIRLYEKGSVEKCVEYLDKYDYVSYMSPDYEVSDPYHLECKVRWIWPTPRLNEELLTTGARGFQMLVWRMKDWISFCHDVINGVFIESGKSKCLGGILDGNAAKWTNRNRKYIGIAPNIKMLHTGWDVYRPISQDQEYLDYKNGLEKSGLLWAGKNTKGNEKINVTEIIHE